ncbi:MAG TPA: PAS domain S-box protein [Gemmatimonadaceae bacterium]|nr:PAS domain S-box protein [Gemmatimonadaceae bacterium]
MTGTSAADSPRDGADAPLQRLAEAAVAFGRSSEERELLHEVARQVRRLLGAAAVLVARTDPETGALTAAMRADEGDEWGSGAVVATAAEAALLAELARTGRTARGGAVAGAPLLGAPLLVGLQLVGAVIVHRGRPAAADDEDLLRALAAPAASALALVRAREESRLERRQSEALAEVAQAVGASLRLDDVLRLTLRHATAVLRAEGAFIALRSGEFLEVVAVSGYADVLTGMCLPENASLAGVVLRSGEGLIVNDTRTDPRTYRPAQRAARAHRLLIMPLVTATGAIGTLVVLNRVTPFEAGDARVLRRLADHAAVAIVNARLYEEVAEGTREWAVAFDAIATGMALLDARGQVTRCNVRAAELAGVEQPATLVGALLVETLFAADAEAAATAATLLRPALRDGVVARGSVRSAARGRVYELVASPHPHGGAVVTFDDVTAVHALSERYRLVVETASDAIVITGAARRIELANPAAAALFARQQLVGVPVADLVACEERERVADFETRAMAGEPQHYETVVVRPDGERRLVAVATAPLREPAGATTVVASLRDVTEERERAAALARSEARHARLLEAAPDGVCAVDAEGRLTSVNPALVHALGRSAEQLVGRPATEFVEPEDRAAARALWDDTLRGQRVRGEIRYRDRGGRLRVCSVITAPITEEGRVVGGFAVLRDVTDERIRAAQLLQQEKLAAVGQLVSGVAHELNNPLAGIMAFAELLVEAPDVKGEERQAAATIHAEARRAAKIVGNLLTFAREHEAVRTVVDLNRVVRTVAELRRYALRAQQVEVVLDLDPALPLTRADEHQLHQVVLNLVTNAEHALQDWDGPRRLTLRTRRDDDRLLVSVSDTGPGIAPAQQGRIFNPFFTTKPVGKGTGLGLSISHGIVREHGGRLTVESEPGHGATFVVELPLAEPAVRRASGAVARPAAAAEPAGGAPTRRSVLVVDDEEAVRLALLRFLGREGYDAEAVGGGRAALARLRDRHFDAVLLDLRMPDLAGDAVYRELVEHDAEQAGRVIFVTGDVRSDRTRAFVEATGCPVVSKPFLLEELGDLLRQHVEDA